MYMAGQLAYIVVMFFSLSAQILRVFITQMYTIFGKR